ncbi:MAG: hypothetical protein E3K32_05720 [wastewater metagenome]|nr:hypothetical protein [Candidatus Loosdrechtia aerotolerans]
MIKNFVLGLLVLIVSVPTILFAEAKHMPSSISWEKSLEDAVAKAKDTGKPVLLDFFMIA